MKQSETREIVVGIAAVLAFTLVLLISYGAERVEAGSGFSQYRLSAVFNRVDGLDIGDRVQVSGVTVGKVEDMALAPDFRARVTFSVRRDIQLPADTSIAIHTDGLFGSKFVVLDPGGDERMLKDGDVILYSQDALIVSELLELIIAEGKSKRAPGTEDRPAPPAADEGREK